MAMFLALRLAGLALSQSVPNGAGGERTVDVNVANRRCAPAPASRDQWEDIAPDARCRVSAFGLVPGSQPTLYYQRQDYHDATTSDDNGTGIVLFAATPGRATLTALAGWSGSNATIGSPRLVRSVQGDIVVIPMSAPIGMVPMDDVVLRVIDGVWSVVSTDTWHVAIPKGVEQRHGNAMDWPSLRAFGALWKRGDPECCATGGSYVAQLRLDRGTLRVASVRYSKRSLSFP